MSPVWRARSVGVPIRLMIGPPGSSKTMLAKHLGGVVSPPTLEEALETTKELPEFPRNAPEVQLQPLADGSVTIARANMTLSIPASFVLVAAMNP